MHCRAKEHITKFNSKSQKLQNESAFFKHLENSHGGRAQGKIFPDYFDITILKAYKKPFTKCVEEGSYISSHQGQLLNSKSEWHQAKIIRTTTTVVQGGAEVVQGGAGGQEAGGREQGGVHGVEQGASHGGVQGGRQGRGAATEPRTLRRSTRGQ